LNSSVDDRVESSFRERERENRNGKREYQTSGFFCCYLLCHLRVLHTTNLPKHPYYESAAVIMPRGITMEMELVNLELELASEKTLFMLVNLENKP